MRGETQPSTVCSPLPSSGWNPPVEPARLKDTRVPTGPTNPSTTVALDGRS